MGGIRRRVGDRAGEGLGSGRARLARLALACFLAVVGVPEDARAQAQAAVRVEVRRLDFVGNQTFPDDSLRRAIVNRRTECRPFLDPLCWLGVGFAFQREFLIRRELPRDVARLHIYHYQRGYRESRVDTTVVYDPVLPEVGITFHIEEGRPVLIDSLAFVGDDVLDGALLRALPIGEGDPLSAIRLDEARDTLLSRLRNAGYVHADVLRSLFIPAARPYDAQVLYDIDAGPAARIGSLDIRVSGEAELSEAVIRRMLPFQEGSLYSEVQIQQGQRNLYGLELVRNALIAIDTARMRVEPDTLVPLIIEVGTNTLHRVRLGGGWNTAECLSADARWASRNLLGGAQRLQIAGRLSNLFAEDLHDLACGLAGTDEFGGINWSLSTELNQPWIFSPRNSLTTSLFWERQSLPDVFIRRSVGLNVVLTRSLATRTPLALSYRPQLSSLEAAGVFFCLSLLVCNPEDIAVLEDPNWLAPVGLGLSRDRTDNLLNPSEGYSAHLDLELASALTGSDFEYARATAEGNWYRRFGRRTVVASRLRGGWVGRGEFGGISATGVHIIHPQKRFFAGGASSVRGFAQNRLGPRVLSVGASRLLGPAQAMNGDTVPIGPCTPEEIVAFTCDADRLSDEEFTPRPTGGTRLLEGNLEYRFMFAPSFQAATFLDFGQVWSERAEVSLDALEWTPGLGVRYFSPIGPLRLDVAYRLRGGEDLPVVTSRIRPFEPGVDRDRDRIVLDVVDAEGDPIPGGYTIPWVRRDELALLAPSVLYGRQRGFFRRVQIHISIGQAF